MPTALVTGANKGIGLETVRQLARCGLRTFLTARDAGRGEAAVARLKKEEGDKLPVEFLALDISDPASIARAAAELPGRIGGGGGGGLDVLVNNAAILEDEGMNILEIDPALVLRTWETNTLGVVRLIQALAPLLAAAPDGARIINLSSGLGQLHDMDSGYPAYSVSKTALNAVTRQFAGVFKKSGQRIAVNSVCPGWVRTDMGGQNADRSVEQGADTVVWLATEAPPDLSAGFFRDRKSIAW